MTLRITTTKDGVLVGVKVQPRASRATVGGEWNGLLKVAVTEPPERGRANRAVEEAVAQWLGVPKRAVEVVSGRTSRQKTLRIDNAAAHAVEKRLGKAVETGHQRS